MLINGNGDHCSRNDFSHVAATSAATQPHTHTRTHARTHARTHTHTHTHTHLCCAVPGHPRVLVGSKRCNAPLHMQQGLVKRGRRPGFCGALLCTVLFSSVSLTAPMTLRCAFLPSPPSPHLPISPSPAAICRTARWCARTLRRRPQSAWRRATIGCVASMSTE